MLTTRNHIEQYFILPCIVAGKTYEEPWDPPEIQAAMAKTTKWKNFL